MNVSTAISNTSPLLYLYRVGALDWLGVLFEEVWIPGAEHGLTERLASYVERLVDAGMWLSPEIRQRILRLANEEQGNT